MNTQKKASGRSAKKSTPNSQKQSKNSTPQKGRNRRQRRGRQRGPSKARASQCALEYARILTDPFGYEAAGGPPPCIPDLLDLPSYKIATKVRSSFAIGAAGFGFVAIYSGRKSNDINFGWQSGSAFALDTIRDTATAGVSGFRDGRFPYAQNEQRAHRLVGVGLRVRYIGTELNRGGYMIPVLANTLGDTLLTESLTQILLRPNVRSIGTDRNWHGVCYKPMTQDAYEYSNADTTAIPSAGGKQPDMAVVVYGVASNQYEFEVIRYHEFLPVTDGGGNVFSVPTQTRSHSDLPGLSMVRDFVGSIASSEMGQEAYKRALNYFANYAVGGGVPTIEWVR